MSVLFPSPLYDVQGPHSVNLYNVPLPINADANLVSPPMWDTIETHGQIVENMAGSQGTMLNGADFSFYDRIIIEPSVIDVGNVLNDQTPVTISIWNGYRVDKIISTFTHTGDEGIDIINPPDIPYTFRPIETLVYNFSIRLDGPTTIDALYVWNIGGINYSATINGSRIVLFAFPPNFRDDFTESLEWKTEILRSFDGSEQRRALRVTPRRSMAYMVSLLKHDSQVFRNLMWGWQNRTFAIPVWSDRQTLRVSQSANDTVLQVDPTNYSFAAGKLLMLFKDSGDCETGEILSLGTNTITLVRGLQKAWPKGTRVYPVILGHLPDQVQVQPRVSSVIEALVSFDTSPDVVDPYLPDAAAATIYDGLEVITVQPNWINPVDVSNEFIGLKLDFVTGVPRWKTRELIQRLGRQYSWLFQDRVTIRKFREFLRRRRGMAKTFWAPSWTDDFDVISPLAFNATNLEVKENQFRKMVGDNIHRDRIMIRTKDGSTYYRRILSVTPALDSINTTLNLDSSLGKTYVPSDFKTIHMLDRCRLATDKVDMIWKSDKVAQVSTTFMTVPQ